MASPDFPLGDSLEVFARRVDAERFLEEVRADDPELAQPPADPRSGQLGSIARAPYQVNQDVLKLGRIADTRSDLVAKPSLPKRPQELGKSRRVALYLVVVLDDVAARPAERACRAQVSEDVPLRTLHIHLHDVHSIQSREERGQALCFHNHALGAASTCMQ